MNVSMQATKSNSSIYVQESGEYYDLQMLDRAIEQLRVARRWLIKDRAMRGLETKGA